MTELLPVKGITIVGYVPGLDAPKFDTAQAKVLLTEAGYPNGFRITLHGPNDTQSITGTVRFGTPDDYADLFLPEVLAKFSRSHPMVTVDVECVGSAHLYERIKRGEMDVALVTFFDNDRQGEILRQEELRWVTSSRHATHTLPNLPLATADPGCQWRKLASDCLTAQGRSFRIAYSSPNRAMLDATVLQGLAIAAMPAISVRPGMRILTAAEGFPALNMRTGTNNNDRKHS